MEERGRVCAVDEGTGAGGIRERGGGAGFGFGAGVFCAASDPVGGIVAAEFGTGFEPDVGWRGVCDFAGG